jgi:PAS domain S-box-containing protein
VGKALVRQNVWRGHDRPGLIGVLRRGKEAGIEPPEEAPESQSKTTDELLAKMTTLRDEAVAHGRDLDEMLDMVTDPMVVYDSQAGIVRCNSAFGAIITAYSQHPVAATLRERASGIVLRDVHGNRVPTDQLPHERLLIGKSVTDVVGSPIVLWDAKGNEAIFSVTGEPLYHGETITGAVVFFRDITERRQREEAMQRANERFQIAERATNGFVYEWNSHDGIIFRSAGFERILGFRPEEIPPTWAAWAQLVYPGDWQAVTDAEEQAYLDALPGETLENEYRVRHRDGHYLTVAEYAVIERDQAGHVVRLIGQIQDITERKRAEEELRRAHDELERRVAERTRELDGANNELRRLSQRILEVQESERRLIARELHDEIGQHLTGVKMLLDALEESIQDGSGSPGAKRVDVSSDRSVYASSMSEISAAVATILERVRDLSLDLRPAVLDSLGLLPALQWQFERYTRLTGVQVEFSADGLDHRLPARLEAAVYRLIQEALTNVARHAGVAAVTVQVYMSVETLSLYVVDAGVGFDVGEALAVGGSTGLAGMRERAALLGGTLTINSLPGEGTTIQADFSIPWAIEEETLRAIEEVEAYEGWRGPQDDAARHRARDELRDRERDQWRDAARDAMRDTTRDALRDVTRDMPRDAQSDALDNQQARRQQEEGSP